WSEIYYQLGRNKNNPLSDDDFLRNYWIIYFHYTKKRGSDYIDYFLNEKFTAEQIYDYNHGNGEGLAPKKLKDYLDKLKTLSQHWYNIHFPNENYLPKERLWLSRLNKLGFMYFRPLITVLFLKNSGINTDGRVKILESIERFIFIHFRLNRNQSNSGETPFYNLANRIASQTDQDSENNIEKIDKALKEQLHRWFKKTDDGKDPFEPKYFNDYIQTRHLGFYGWNGLHYFLYEYEYSLFSNYGNEKIEWSLFVKPDGNDKVSIEHIYPQNPKDEDWQDFINYSADERKLLQNSLGNLLPLSFSINSSLQNICFKDKKNQKLDAKGNEKRRGYTQGSHCEIEVAKNEIWTADTIKQRGLKLLKFMEKHWDISLGDDSAKIQLLGLSFLDDAKIEKEKEKEKQ
ncbi:HNH endonuclease family protein, partial [Moraxella catarrhalis]|uniref:HNH endonuclease family protein n=1 Tax=Moraxella catarrhalis TaxID=480 RepID=UPI000A5D98D5